MRTNSHSAGQGIVVDIFMAGILAATLIRCCSSRRHPANGRRFACLQPAFGEVL
jgi:hypothetical protein